MPAFGIMLALFLPMHFLALGLALDGAGTLDRFLAFAELPLVKASDDERRRDDPSLPAG